MSGKHSTSSAVILLRLVNDYLESIADEAPEAELQEHVDGIARYCINDLGADDAAMDEEDWL